MIRKRIFFIIGDPSRAWELPPAHPLRSTATRFVGHEDPAIAMALQPLFEPLPHPRAWLCRAHDHASIGSGRHLLEAVRIVLRLGGPPPRHGQRIAFAIDMARQVVKDRRFLAWAERYIEHYEDTGRTREPQPLVALRTAYMHALMRQSEAQGRMSLDAEAAFWAGLAATINDQAVPIATARSVCSAAALKRLNSAATNHGLVRDLTLD